MIKIWCKTLCEDKITRDIIFEKEEDFDGARFEEYLREVCNALDIPTPILLSKHYNHFMDFNLIKFIPDDFVESIDFDYLILENF